MPLLVEPRPSTPADLLGAPEDAQEASYLAASARMRSFLVNPSSILFMLCSNGKKGKSGSLPMCAAVYIAPAVDKVGCRMKGCVDALGRGVDAAQISRVIREGRSMSGEILCSGGERR